MLMSCFQVVNRRQHLNLQSKSEAYSTGVISQLEERLDNFGLKGYNNLSDTKQMSGGCKRVGEGTLPLRSSPQVLLRVQFVTTAQEM